MFAQNKALNFGRYVPNDRVLNKKVPDNPKFKNVKPTVDTGKNVKHQIAELKEKQKSLVHRKDEVFKRIKLSTFFRLAIAVAKDSLREEERADQSPRNDENENNESNKEDRNRLANVLIGIGEIDLRNAKGKVVSKTKKIDKIDPYLLLDVRDRDDFSQCHIKTAKHYPSAMLSRTTGYELEEMKLYKNNRPELIVIYDDDESIACRVATTLVQRGYDNIYLLSGGLKLAFEVFPRLLIVSVTAGSNLAARFGPSQRVSISTAPAEYFTMEDVNNAQQYLEDCPLANNPAARSSKSASSFVPTHPSTTRDTKSSLLETKPKNFTTMSRNDSACSMHSIELFKSRAPSRCTMDEKTSRKAPWK